MKIKDLVTEAVEEKTRKLLKKARKKTARVIDDSNLADVFGIDMEGPVTSKKRRKKTIRKKTSPGTKKPKSIFETVVGIVKGSRRGVTVATIREKTGFDEVQIRNVIYRARQQGKIKNKERGVYISA